MQKIIKIINFVHNIVSVLTKLTNLQQWNTFEIETLNLILFWIFVGAAHGLSGILQVLLGFPEYIKSDPSAEKDIRDSVEFLVTCLENEGNIQPALDECGRQVRPAEQELLHWCHGAPGELLFICPSIFLHLEKMGKGRHHIGLIVKGF